MKRFGWGLRIARLALVGLAAWMAYHWLAPSGRGWWVPAVAGGLALLWAAALLWRRRVRRREDARAERWATALMTPALRAEVIAELESEVSGCDPVAKPSHHAHRSLTLAELLEADGRAEAATDVLEEIRSDALSTRLAAVVSHARAVAWLSAGQPNRAVTALNESPSLIGDPVVALRIRLLRGLIAVEQGDTERAFELVEDVRDELGDNPELRTEALVLEAVALEAKGDESAALAALREVGADMLEVLVLLGLPRVRALARRARGGAPSGR